MTTKPALISVLIALAGCATNPDKIAPAPVDQSLYARLPCEEVAAKRAQARDDLTAQERQQRSTAKHDAWGVLLVGIPMGSLGGGDVAGRIAQLKGELLALEAATARCAP